MKKIIGLTCLLALVMAAQPALADLKYNPVNGHAYELVTGGPWNWDQAKAAAEARGGHLVSITSQQENDFLTAELVPPSGAWIGGSQDPAGAEPGDGWGWVTGEAWNFTAWAGGEPNNAGGNEECAHFWSPTGSWNDINCTSVYSSYVAEYEDGTARFRVVKSYTDSNVNRGDVMVSIQCNNGLPSSDSAPVTPGDPIGHTFVVTNIGANMECVITEDVPSGYSATYNGGVDSCTFDPVRATEYACSIVNTPLPVTIRVNKDWILPRSGGNEVSQFARIELVCDGVYQGFRNLTGDGFVTWSYTPLYPSSTCSASEQINDSAVESDASDCQGLVVSAGSGATCTITNTVFFEGIPTLSQYGMAIMALMMLGLGFVGFRRFV